MNFFLEHWSQKANTEIVSNVIGVERYFIGSVLNVLRIIGVGAALIMLTWMSISYFTADGRGAPWAVEKKADIKGQQLRNFAIGIAVFVGASYIVTFIVNFLWDIFET